MDLWIRSQDKMNLVKVNQININYKNTCQIIANYIPDFIGTEGEYYETLGTYRTKERALEILDEIQNILKNNQYGYKVNGLGEKVDIIPNQIFVYEMPEE